MNRRRRSAFTLIETLFAIFLVFACAVIVAATMPMANTSRAKADLLNKAMGLAQKQLEAIHGVGFQNTNATQLASYGLIDSAAPVGLNTYSFSNSDSSNRDNPALILPGGSGTVTLNPINANEVQVIITVNYQDSQRSRSTSVGTIIANL